MQRGVRGKSRWLGLIVLCGLQVGCLSVFKGHEGPALPEQVYQQPVKNAFSHAQVGVFAFDAPADAADLGVAAGRALHRRLLGSPVLGQPVPEFGSGPLDLDGQLQLARQKGYRLIITGQITYFLAGSLMQGARIDQTLRVYEVVGERLLWYAAASAAGDPVPARDWLLFALPGRPAPSLMTLMERNAAKFMALLAQNSAYAKEMEMISQGYACLVKRQDDQAKGWFEKVLAVNPANPYAYLNLGVIHERLGDAETAGRMYREVIRLDPQAEIEASTDPRFVGRPLVELAADNLDRLERLAAPPSDGS